MTDPSQPAGRSYGRDRAPLDRELRAMRDRLRQVPAEFPEPGEANAPATYPVVTVLGGNDLGGSIDGVKKSATLIDLSSVTYDPGYQASAGAITIAAGAITAVAAPTGLAQGSVYATCTATVVGDGVGAIITPTVSGGKITGFTVTAGGSGYTTATITLSPPDGVPAGLDWSDGIGYGNLTSDGVTFERVLIVHDTRAPIEYALPASMTFASPVTITVCSRTVNGVATTTKVRTAVWA